MFTYQVCDLEDFGVVHLMRFTFVCECVAVTATHALTVVDVSWTVGTPAGSPDRHPGGHDMLAVRSDARASTHARSSRAHDSFTTHMGTPFSIIVSQHL